MALDEHCLVPDVVLSHLMVTTPLFTGPCYCHPRVTDTEIRGHKGPLRIGKARLLTTTARSSWVCGCDGFTLRVSKMAHCVHADVSFVLAIQVLNPHCFFQELLQKYSHLYDLSRSDRGRLQEQAVAMCLDGQPLRMIQQLMEVAVGPLDISPKDIVQSAIRKIISALRSAVKQSLRKTGGDILPIIQCLFHGCHKDKIPL